MLPKSDAVGYHTRFGMRDKQYRLRSIEFLKEKGYTDCELEEYVAFLVFSS